VCFFRRRPRIVRVAAEEQAISRCSALHCPSTADSLPTFEQCVCEFQLSYEQCVCEFQLSYEQCMCEFQLSYEQCMCEFQLSCEQCMCESQLPYDVRVTTAQQAMHVRVPPVCDQCIPRSVSAYFYMDDTFEHIIITSCCVSQVFHFPLRSCSDISGTQCVC
jgi:hypothetical protein